MKKIIVLLPLMALIISNAISQGVSYAPNDDVISTIQKQIASISIDDDHCEVPCGIYGDSLRIALINEHITTVEKAMKQINEISKAASPNYNQLIRWVNNKETHAEEIQHIVAQYFLHQRIKMPKSDLGKKAFKKANGKYVKQLSSLHAILVYAMKSKQTTDLANTEALKKAVESFESLYFHKHEH